MKSKVDLFLGSVTSDLTDLRAQQMTNNASMQDIKEEIGRMGRNMEDRSRGRNSNGELEALIYQVRSLKEELTAMKAEHSNNNNLADSFQKLKEHVKQVDTLVKSSSQELRDRVVNIERLFLHLETTSETGSMPAGWAERLAAIESKMNVTVEPVVTREDIQEHGIQLFQVDFIFFPKNGKACC